MKRKIVKYVLRIIAFCILGVGIATFLFPAMFTTLQGKDYNVKYNGELAPLNGIRSLIVSDDVLYALTSGSDCLIAFDLKGNVLYSIYLAPAVVDHSMAVDQNGNIIVNSTSDGPYLVFDHGKLLRRITRSNNEFNRVQSLVSEQADYATLPKDKRGNSYGIGLLRTTIIQSDKSGSSYLFVSNPYPYYLVSSPFPSAAYVAVGCVMLWLIRRHEKKTNRDYIYVGPNGH